MGLIVNADDFGKSKDVNKAIVECFNKGYIDRTTVMVNMPLAEETFEISSQNGFSDKVGIHLNLTEGRPLSEGIKNNPLFCDESGYFTARFYGSTKLRLHMDKKTVDDIYTEFKAQFEKYIEMGFTLNHVDSHHHVHTNYPMLKALKKLSKEYDFSSIRLSRNLYLGGGLLQKVYKDFYNHSVKKICKLTTDYFGSYEDAISYSRELNKADDKAFRRLLSGRTLEIMVHPMYSAEGTLVDTEVPFLEENLFYETIR